ncbi:hypothetical protein L6452_37100 [Arctium lappa]|uniref:Uncharacterized protein n=1 Tax=Arctium lappa TaxID=4217 RepID=A0ACB8Y246_ARCLA|nr:hypothetical protein L6452_37100 [Arctium lappa]
MFWVLLGYGIQLLSTDVFRVSIKPLGLEELVSAQMLSLLLEFAAVLCKKIGLWVWSDTDSNFPMEMDMDPYPHDDDDILTPVSFLRHQTEYVCIPFPSLIVSQR